MIYLGADHGGFELKKKIKLWLEEWKLVYKDLGPDKLDPADDYPPFAFAVAQKVAEHDDMSLPWNKRPKGILLCRSAIGVTIAANKIPNIRAGAVYDIKMARHARCNDDVNVLCLSGDSTSERAAKEIIKTWLDTEFSKETRHTRRINQILDKEQSFSGGHGCEEGKCCCGD